MTGAHLGRINDTGALSLWGGSDHSGGAKIDLYGKDHSTYSGCASIRTVDANNNIYLMTLKPDGTLTWGSKNVAMTEDVVPRSGGAVITGNKLGRISNNGFLRLDGGTGFDTGSSITVHGKDLPNSADKGKLYLHTSNGTLGQDMMIYPDGTWTWSGTAVQTTSDQRLKQQITEIDDKLLDAWEDVHPCQFKYNDAVDQKGTTARLHTGYVVQQIDEACKSHNLDISAYGLYCHEEYPERTEEVTTENEDGTTSKETKVIEPAREHYSLRYTETLVVECAYLRREVSRLKQQNEDLEQRLKMLENK